MTRVDGRPVRVMAVVSHLVGGIRTYLSYVYGGMRVGDYRFRSSPVTSDETSVLEDNLTAHSLKVIRVPQARALGHLTSAIFRHLWRTKPDVVHAHGFSSAIAVAAATRVSRVPVIVTSHDVIEAHALQGELGRFRRSVLGWALSRATIVQSVGHDAHANLLNAIPTLRRHTGLRVILNGIDPTLNAAVHSLDGHDHEGRPTRFVFVGRPMPQKGFVDVISAVERLHKQHAFTVVVCGDGGFIREYRADIERRGLKGCFEFRGFMPAVAPRAPRRRRPTNALPVGSVPGGSNGGARLRVPADRVQLHWPPRGRRG